tara:strand:+ start:642 stop:1244 length:603 start_codon:yes stop_codon:yes gene_type:complete
MTNPKNITTAMFNAINNLTKPMQIKVLKKLGIYVPKDAPGRTAKGAGITVGKIRVAAKEASDQWKGAVKGVGTSAAVVASYSASDFINDLLGITKMGDSDLKADNLRSENIKRGKLKSESLKKSTVKPPPSKPKTYKTIDGKVLTEKQYLKYLDEKQDITAKNKKILKEITGNKGNKGMLVNNKKRFGNMDYRKGGMVIK